MSQKLLLLAAFLFMVAATIFLMIHAPVYVVGLLVAGALGCVSAYFNVR